MGIPYPDGPLGITRVLDTGTVYLEFPVEDTNQLLARVQALKKAHPEVRILGTYPEGMYASGS